MPVIFILLAALFAPAPVSRGLHPVYVSVTQIDFNQKEKSLELTCRVFTNDYEKILRKLYKGKVDLLGKENRTRMDSLASAYMSSHLGVSVNGRKMPVQFLGYEQETDGILNYLEITGVDSVKEIIVDNSVLYDLWEKQLNVIHVTVNQKRKSTRLSNPSSRAVFYF